MDLDTDNKILQILAEGGSMDYSIWPELLSRLIPRLEQIAHDDFLVPTIGSPSSPPHATLSQIDVASQQSISSQNIVGSSQSADKENAPPTALQPAHPDNENNINTLPPQILSLLESITQTLTIYFSLYPPHTIQRLSELILTPKYHYRSLLSYLHALDRVVHVTSGANIYPLPAAVQDSKALPNGTNSGIDPNSIFWGSSTHTVPSLGSDESLGGALLTPIPWLRPQNQVTINNGGNHVKKLAGEVKTESTETIDGPNGAGSIETVSISVNGIPSATLSFATSKENRGDLQVEGGVTQGELLRQEQRVDMVPITQLTNLRSPRDVDEVKSEDEEEKPHARGPSEVGIEDMGPQAAGSVGVGIQGIDVEAAVGRRADEHDEANNDRVAAPTTPKREAVEELGGEKKRVKDEVSFKSELQGEDETMALVDVNGKEKSATKFEGPKEDTGIFPNGSVI